MNNFAISSTGIGEAMQRSASALYEAGNTIDESIALITGANSVIQNPEQVGTALKTLALRLRGAKTELEEAGLETDNMAESTSTLQAKLKALTHGKVDIMLDADTFKNTTQILREMAGAWEDMTDIERAAALELMGGKRQANILASVIKNFDTVEDVITTSMNSAGSAIAENEKYLNSIQGKIDQFTNALQTLWMNLLDSNAVKAIIDFGTYSIKLLDTVHGKIMTIIAAFMLYNKIRYKDKFADMFGGFVEMSGKVLSSIKSIITGTQTLTKADIARALASKGVSAQLVRQIIAEAGLKGVTGSLTKEQIKATAATLSAKLANGDLTTSQYLATMSTMGLKTALQGLWTVLMQNPFITIAAVITVAALAFDHFHTTAQEAAEKAKKSFEEIQSVVESTKSTIQELESELSTLQGKIEELDGKQLSFAEDQELEKLKKQREELEHSLKVQEQLLELQRDASNKQAIASMKAYTKAASEGAQETQDTAKTWGTIAGVIGGIALTVASGGTGLALIAAGGVAGGVVGNKAGEAMGSGIAENDGTYDDWYETYTKALETAREEEQKALKKYQKDSSNIDKLDKWQEAQQKTSDIETEMYEHLSQMQQYFNGLEYGISDDIDKELDTWYNFLDKMSINQGASGSEVTALDRIFGENASEEIQSIKEQILNTIQSGKEFDFDSAVNSSQQLKNILDYVGLSAEDVKNYFTQIGEATKNITTDKVIPVETYAALSEDAEKYKEILLQTAEITVDNTKVTEEYKEALIALVGSEEEVNEYFDDNNKLLVKDAKGLNNLVKSTKKNTAANASLAKSQARLQYYNLYKQIRQLVNGQQVADKATLSQVNSLYAQMNVLEKTIAKYSMLEAQLLDAGNAYNEFEAAQEADSQTDYISSVESWVLALGEAFTTAELGSETAQAAIAGLVPESVYEDLDTVDEKMAAIHKYFSKGKIAQYFDLSYDDDGSITGVEMKLGNLRKFIEDGLSNGVFNGADWQHFDLSKDIDSLEEFANTMEVTEEVAFAFIKSLEDHDIEWLNGDYSSIFEDILPDNLANDIYANTSALADLEVQIANGKITAEEYTTKWNELTQVSQENAQKARENASAWIDASNDVNKAKTKVQELSSELDVLYQQGASEAEIKIKTNGLEAAKKLLADSAQKLSELETMDPVVLQVALDQAQAEIDTFEEDNSTLLTKVKIVQNAETEEYEYNIKPNIELTEDEKKKLEGYLEDVNAKYSFENALGEDIVTAEEHLSNIEKILQDIYNAATGKAPSNTPSTDSTTVTDSTNTAESFNFKEFFTTTIPEAWDEFWGDIESFFAGIGEQANALKEDLSKFFTETVPEKWDEFWNSVSEFFAPLVEQANILREKATTFFTETVPEKWDEFWTKAGEVWNDIQVWAEATKAKVVSFFTETLPEKWGQFWDKVGEVWNNVQTWAEMTKGRVTNFFTETLPQKWDEFWEKIDTFLTENLPYALGYAAGAVVRFFTETIPQKWDEFWNAVGESWDDTVEWALMLKDKIVEFFTETLPDAWSGFWDDVAKFIDESIMPALSSCANAVKAFFTQTVPQKWNEFWNAVGEVWNDVRAWAGETKDEVVAFFTQTIPTAWSNFWNSVGEFIDESIIPALQSVANAIKSFFTETIPTKWSDFWTGVGNFIDESIIPALQSAKDAIVEFFVTTIPQKWNEFWDSVSTFITTTLPTALETVKTGVTTFFTVTLPEKINGLWDGIASWITEKATSFWESLKGGFKSGKEGAEYNPGASGAQQVNGTAHAKGTAHKTGNWGLPTSERNSLVGELGQELVVDPQSGRYYTVGDNGAEMVDLPKGAIIFNHKQTEALLSRGHVAGRGKAYAEGNAHVTIWPTASSKQQWEGTGYSGPNDPTYDLSEALSNAADSISDAADKFEEVFDWVEVRLEEIEEQLNLLNAQLENAVGYLAKNQIIDAALNVNNTKLTNLEKGMAEYERYAAALLSKIPSSYRDAAKNGAIAIEEFAGDADEKTLKAIQDYREWAQKAADLKQQIEELKTEIADLAQQKFDNVADQFDNQIGLIEAANDKLDAQVSLMEDRDYVAAKEYYESMMANTKGISAELVKERDTLQAVLDEQVKLGNIKVGSDAWYEMVEQLYDVDASIVECTSDLEDFQNAINDIYWDNFDELISRYDYLSDETQNLIDLMDEADMVSKPDDEDGWAASEVEWTEEGIASLGLYAQQMEIAEYKSKQYAKAIEDLNKDYKDGKYSESEYLEKLNELKDAQYDSIEAYYEAQEAIRDLNEARIDEIKNGIEKQIKAYEKLIEKQKEELDAEKDLNDFQKSVAEQQKNVTDIQRKLDALANDHSISAAAKRKQLQAELAEAEYELEELYNDRSYEDKQNALDKELESFQEQKEKEIEEWEKYLENIEQVVTESLGIVQANASGIYDTLSGKAEEYNLTLSESITTPWKDGEYAISSYQEVFDTAASSTTDQLAQIKLAWQEVIDVMSEAAEVEIAAQEKANNRYVSTTATKSSTSTTSKPATNNTSTAKSTPSVGQTVKVKSSATHFSAQSGNARMASFVPGGTYQVMQVGINGDKSQILIGKNGQYTGWVKLTDLEGYAKGTIGVDNDQFAWLDELGEELVMHADGNGRLSFLTKGTSVIPADITKNLMQLGQLNPQDILDRSRPTISAPHIINNNIELKMDIAEVVHIDTVTNDTIPNLTKAIDKQLDKYMKNLNNQVRKYSR